VVVHSNPIIITSGIKKKSQDGVDKVEVPSSRGKRGFKGLDSGFLKERIRGSLQGTGGKELQERDHYMENCQGGSLKTKGGKRDTR